MKIYVLLTHLWGDYELVGAFTEESKFIEAYQKLEKRNDLEDRGDIEAFCIETDRAYDKAPPEAWVYQGQVETHNDQN